ncbi:MULTISPECIES: AAA family ATPase [unclassified Pseudomonas]|uniref:AAA family ATPase n=1 Tax=unclassified Pseudomonas TaxID=196821 RepID=UPI001CBF34F6|nr:MULTISPECIES: AAA family ATPase [unclassified Pseudomonas]
MNLCFVWVKDFKNLQGVGLNFSNELEFHFEATTRILSQSEKDPMPSLFGEQITSITGILGVNGSGKTNSLELICRALKSPEKLKNDYILIYSVEGALFYSTNIKEKINSGFEIAAGTEDHLDNFHTIYFSNVFDKNYIDFGGGVVDVSVNNKNNPRTLARQRHVMESDFLNDLDFLHSPEFASIELQPPPRVEIKIDRFISRHDRNLDEDEAMPVLRYFAEVRRGNKNRDKVAVVAQTIQIEFLKALLINVPHKEKFTPVMNSILASEGEFDLKAFIITFRDMYLATNAPVPWDNNFSMFESLTVLLKLESFFDEMHLRIDDTVKGSRYTFTINYEDSESFYYRHLACILQGVRYSSITWAGISSGQRAYFNLFSSIWNGMQNQRLAPVKRQGTLICIDEGDLYLHPQWQIEFIDRLIKSLPKISGGKIQVVITTHSPILISDLPRQCIVLLNRHGDSSAACDTDSIEVPKTFAANLYDIYQYSFGLQHKRSGNLSSRYLKKIYSLLDKKILSDSEAHELKLAISVIDDEIIKYHIKSRVDVQ